MHSLNAKTAIKERINKTPKERINKTPNEPLFDIVSDRRNGVAFSIFPLMIAKKKKKRIKLIAISFVAFINASFLMR